MWKRSEREKQQRVDTRRRVAQKLGPTARVILSQTQGFGDGGYSLKRWSAGSGNRSRCHDAVIFVCTHETSHVGTNMAHRVLNSSTQENLHLTMRCKDPSEEVDRRRRGWTAYRKISRPSARSRARAKDGSGSHSELLSRMDGTG